jgi:hypothetical protein
MANSGVASGAYKNTFDNTEDDKLMVLVADLFAEFERKRKENWAAVIRGRNETLTARRIACTRDLHAFCGRLMLSCPTRGGAVFDALLALLCTGQVNGAPIPLLVDKVRAIMKGCCRFSAEVDEKVMSNGERCVLFLFFFLVIHSRSAATCTAPQRRPSGCVMRWVVRPLVASSLRCTAPSAGSTERATCRCVLLLLLAHAHDASQNRHGHCNSNPNRSLVKTFSGFKFA